MKKQVVEEHSQHNIGIKILSWNLGLYRSKGTRCEEVVENIEERPSTIKCCAPGDLHEVVDEGWQPIEDGQHDRLEEHHPDQAWIGAVFVKEGDEVAGEDSAQPNGMRKSLRCIITGKEDAGDKEDYADDKGDQRLLGSKRCRARVDDKG